MEREDAYGDSIMNSSEKNKVHSASVFLENSPCNHGLHSPPVKMEHTT